MFVEGSATKRVLEWRSIVLQLYKGRGRLFLYPVSRGLPRRSTRVSQMHPPAQFQP